MQLLCLLSLQTISQLISILSYQWLELILQPARGESELLEHKLKHEINLMCRERQKQIAPPDALCDELPQALHHGHNKNPHAVL